MKVMGDSGWEYDIRLTPQEVDSAITQLGARLDELKAKVTDGKNSYDRVTELVAFIAPIQSVHDKLMEARCSD